MTETEDAESNEYDQNPYVSAEEIDYENKRTFNENSHNYDA